MSDIILSGGKKTGVDISGNASPKHSSLRGLDFESSGHNGFQKELAKEQLEAIDSISGKEDKSNKIDVLDLNEPWKYEFLGQYPTAYATAVAIIEQALLTEGTAIEMAQSYTDSKTGWELIESKTLKEDVTEIVKNLTDSYKELYWVFKVPTINAGKTAGFPKGRMILYSNGNQIVAFDQNYSISDTGNEWYLSYHMTMMGKHCSVFKAYKDPATDITSSAYIQLPPFNQYETGWQAGKDIGRKSMSYLKLTMMCQTSGARYFPAGTKYELWGVSA